MVADRREKYLIIDEIDNAANLAETVVEDVIAMLNHESPSLTAQEILEAQTILNWGVAEGNAKYLRKANQNFNAWKVASKLRTK